MVDYASRPRHFILTPKRKPLGKAIARGSRTAIISQCLKQAEMRTVLVKKLGKLVQKELVHICSTKFKSTLLQHSKHDMTNFSWSSIIAEMKDHAPILLEILLAATHTKQRRSNQELVIAMCTAMLCKLRRAEMSTAQKVISMILYAGHSSKQV